MKESKITAKLEHSIANEGMLFLDHKLIKAKEECMQLEHEYRQLESDIEVMESKLDSVKERIDLLSSQMEIVKGRMLAKISQTNKFSEDPFVNDFIRASYFSLRNTWHNHNPLFKNFQYVNLTETELQASNRHQLITIKCPHIPNELKNTKVIWSVRDNFKNHIKTDVVFPNIHSVIPSNENSKLYPNVSPENFYPSFKPVSLTIDFPTVYYLVRIDFDGIDVWLNQDYLNTALICIGGAFNLYVRDTLGALTMENESTSIVLMPVKYSTPVRRKF